MTIKKILVVGGVAGGASSAARLRRLDETADITVYERGPHVSFSNCALPYYLSGVVSKSSQLVMMSPEKFKKQYNIDVKTDSEVLTIDRTKKIITVRDLITNTTYEDSYDKLILSPGAAPVIPKSIDGTSLPHVFMVRNVVDITKLKNYISEKEIKDVSVIGGGFIGIEMAENLRKDNKNVTLVEAAEQILMPFDYDMVQILHKELIDNGVCLITGDGLAKIGADSILLQSGRTIKSDVVIMAIGVEPEIALAKDAGLEIGESGGIRVNHNFQTSDKDIYAVGDAIEVYNALTHRPLKLSLAGPAQKQARAASDNICGISTSNHGVIGSCVLRVFEKNAAATGINERVAKELKIPFDSVYIIPFDRPSLMPEARPMHFKLVFEVPTGRILGAQAIGSGSVDKRIDIIATLIRMNGTLTDLKDLELCYSPLFGTAKDVVNQAALVGLNIQNGIFNQVHVSQVRDLVDSNEIIIDVREEIEFNNGHIKGAKNIPLSQLRQRIDEIPKHQPVYVHCRTSQRSYNAIMILKAHGYEQLYNISGSFLGLSFFEYYEDTRQGREKIVTEYNFR